MLYILNISAQNRQSDWQEKLGTLFQASGSRGGVWLSERERGWDPLVGYAVAKEYRINLWFCLHNLIGICSRDASVRFYSGCEGAATRR
jgi:hypothetical protein